MTTPGDTAWQVHQFSWDQEKYFLEEMHRRLVFFGSLIPAIVGATTAGLIAASAWWHFAGLLVGPILVLLIGSTAEEAMWRSYRRVLEAITLRAKAGHDLGMDEPRGAEGDWVSDEPYLVGRHQRGRTLVTEGTPIREDFVVPFFPDPLAVQLRLSVVRTSDPDASGPGIRFRTADEFVDAHVGIGVQSNYRLFFRGVKWLSWLLLLGLGSLVWKTATVG